MKFEETPEEAAFRAEVRDWLEGNAPGRATGTGSASGPDGDEEAFLERARAWQRQLAEGGWAGITWPREYGGRGASPIEAVIFGEELAKYDVPLGPFLIAQGLVGPTLIVHGTEEQKGRHLPRILSGEEIWCQLWSEPNAGSDLAGLQTRAVRDPGSGDWILNGQKVWTSWAHRADYGICVARTDPDVPKHRGITCFIVDMQRPGISARPLRQITGEAHFNEVFFDDVCVSQQDIVGDVNDGWRVAITVLMNERHAITGDARGVKMEDLLELAKARGAFEDPVHRQEIADVYIRSKLLWLLGCRTRTKLSQGAAPGPEGSVGKLARAELGTRVAEVAGRLLGPASIQTDGDAPERGRWAAAYLSQPAAHIAGGTDEIQRNIIGERVLGLPKDLRVDKDLPFRELKARRTPVG